MISYLIHIAIALYFVLGLEFLHSYAAYLAFPFFLIFHKASRSTKGAWKRGKELQPELARSQQAATLVLTSVEFHEAQSFFVLAIQTASLLTFRDIRSGTDAEIQYLVIANTSFNLAVNSMLPVLLLQVCLQCNKIRSWYTLSLTTLCFVLALVSLGNNPGPFLTAFEALRDVSRTSECGGNPHLKTMCYYFVWKGSGDFSLLELTQPILPVHILGVATLPVLIADHALYLLCDGPLSKRVDSKFPRRAQYIWTRAGTVVWPVLQLVMLAFTVMYLSAIIKLLYRLPAYPGFWSFGQVVALCVWAPVVWRYTYFSIGKSLSRVLMAYLSTGKCPFGTNVDQAGVKVAYLTRLPRSFKLVRQEVSPDESIRSQRTKAQRASPPDDENSG